MIIKPVLTEKSAALMPNGVYVFSMPGDMNKNEVAKVVKDVYKVTPVAVRVVNLPDKVKNFRRREGVRSGLSKAYVTLKKGETIKGFETLTETKETKTEEKKVKNA